MTANSSRITAMATAWEAFGVAFDSLPSAISTAGIPMVAALAVFMAGAFSGDAAVAGVATIGFVAALVCSAWAVTIVSQAKALGVDIPLQPGAIFLKARFWKFAGASVACFLIPTAIMVLTIGLSAAAPSGSPGLSSVALLAGLAASFYVSLRLFLVLPAIVAGHPFSLAASWRLTGGSVLPIAGSLFLCLLPVSILESLIEAGAKSSETGTAKVTGALAILAVALMQALLTGAVAGLAYRKLGKDGPLAGASATA